MNFKLSPSALNLMKECPRCFWLTQHKVWKRPSGPFPSLPSGMDKILKEHFDKFMDKGELLPELKENGHTKNMKLFNDHALLAIWRSNFKGISYEDKNGNILRGAVDNILMKGKKLIVLDYKTRGYPLKEDTADHYQNQLEIIVVDNNSKSEDYSFLIFYVPKEVSDTGEVIFDTELVKMKVNVKNAENIWKKAIKLLNSDCPKESCKWCDGR